MQILRRRPASSRHERTEWPLSFGLKSLEQTPRTRERQMRCSGREDVSLSGNEIALLRLAVVQF
tara:strand:+ start:570 stop:761 length:192 start_codon:yes stop_codon:yes gene_type:complete